MGGHLHVCCYSHRYDRMRRFRCRKTGNLYLQRRFRNYYYPSLRTAGRPRLPSFHCCRYCTGRHSCKHHVHCRLTAFNRCLQCIPEPAAGLSENQNECKSLYGCRTHHCSCCCSCWNYSGLGSKQFRIYDCILCLGRIWSCLWTRYAVFPFLEENQFLRRSGRYDFRRNHGLCMEIRDSSFRRSMEYL